MRVPLKPRGESLTRLRDASLRLRRLRELLNCAGPLCALDIEGTGPFRDYDRVVEVGAVKLKTDGTFSMVSTLVNPCGMSMSDGAREKTGISDDMLVDAPRFVDLAPILGPGLQGVALVGYNLRQYDIPVLNREFRLAGFNIDLEQNAIVDGFSIFQQKHPRDLDAAVRQYLGRDRAESHEAGVDVLDTVDVLVAQLEQHADLPRELGELAAFCDRKKPEYIDRAGKFQWRNGVAIVAFSKHQGTPMHLVDAGFYQWMLRGDFPGDTKEIALRAANGEFPRLSESNVPKEATDETDVADAGDREATAPAQTGLFAT